MKRYAIGPLHLDVEQRVLYMGSEVVALSPKSFEILLVLVENAGQVISRDTLRERVWGDAFIEDANLSNNISTLRSVLRQHLGDVQPIKTFSKRGYQFTLPVHLDKGSGPHHLITAPEPAALLEASPSASLPLQWKTRSNLVLALLLVLGLGVTLTLIRHARSGTLPQHRPASALLSVVRHAGDALKSMQPIPSLLATAALLGIAAAIAVRHRRHPGLASGNLLLALSFLVGSQILWTVAQETALRNTIGMLGQVLLGLTLAAYQPRKPKTSGLWLFVLDLLPLLAFVICCGLDLRKASVYVSLSAAGRLMLLGTYILRRDAWLPVLVSVAGWISMALLAAGGYYLAAGFLGIAIAALYAAVNLALRLPRENIGKPLLVAGLLLWALYAGTYPAAFAYGPLQPLWSLQLNLAKLLVTIGIALFLLKSRPAPQLEMPPV